MIALPNIKFAIKFLHKIFWGHLSGILFGIISMLASLFMIGLQKNIIDDVFLNGNYHKLGSIITLLGIAILIFFTAHFIYEIIMNRNQQQLIIFLSESLFLYLYKIPSYVYHNLRVGSLVNYFKSDIQIIAKTLVRNLTIGIVNIIKLLILVVIIFYSQPIILLTIIVLTTIYIIIGKYFGPLLKEKTKQVQENRGHYVEHIEEGISSSREVIAFNRLTWESDRINKIFKKYFGKIMEEAKLSNQQLCINTPIKWGVNLVVLGFGGVSVIKGEMSLGTFVIVYQFSSQLIDSLQHTYNFIISTNSNFSSINRLRELVYGPQDLQGDKNISGTITEIKFEEIYFRYSPDTSDILRGLDLCISTGKKIAFVGFSGCGKSTIVQLLTCSFFPQSGSITINGIPLHEIKREEWLKRISIVFQEPYLFPDTIYNNLLMGNVEVNKNQIVNICKMVEIHNFIMQLPYGYDTEIGERGIKFSGGQRQRLAIARALVSNSEILILDEATSALDLETERKIISNIDNYRKGKTTIIIAHRLSTIENSDTIFVLDQGRIFEQGSHQDLMSRGKLYPKIHNKKK